MWPIKLVIFFIKFIYINILKYYHKTYIIELGREVKRYLKEGRLVPDDTMIALTVKEIECLADKDWLLDGKF